MSFGNMAVSVDISYNNYKKNYPHICTKTRHTTFSPGLIPQHSKINSVDLTLKEYILALSQRTYGPTPHSVKVTQELVLHLTLIRIDLTYSVKLD